MYKVKRIMDEQYKVIEFYDNDNDINDDEVAIFHGSLADCEAWIRLKESGRLD
jgi:hypothetical protein